MMELWIGYPGFSPEDVLAAVGWGNTFALTVSTVFSRSPTYIVPSAAKPLFMAKPTLTATTAGRLMDC